MSINEIDWDNFTNILDNLSLNEIINFCSTNVQLKNLCSSDRGQKYINERRIIELIKYVAASEGYFSPFMIYDQLRKIDPELLEKYNIEAFEVFNNMLLKNPQLITPLTKEVKRDFPGP